MEARLQKWGNSTGIRIPSSILKSLNIKANDVLCIEQDEDRIIITLFYIEDFTDKEIGKILNLKENTVKTKRTRIKEKIKNNMKKGEEVNG